MLAPASIRVAAHSRLLCTCHLSTTCGPVDTVTVGVAEAYHESMMPDYIHCAPWLIQNS
jgi:hypothetical protein